MSIEIMYDKSIFLLQKCNCRRFCNNIGLTD
jgi:hypothetical protein